MDFFDYDTERIPHAGPFYRGIFNCYGISVNIKNLTLTRTVGNNHGISSGSNAGIDFTVIIENVKFNSFAQAAINMKDRAMFFKIQNCIFDRCNFGIVANAKEHNLWDSNYFNLSSYNANMPTASSIIRDNRFSRAEDTAWSIAIQLLGHGCVISNNFIENYQTGIHVVHLAGTPNQEANRNIISNNFIKLTNDGTGIIGPGLHGLVSNNHIHGGSYLGRPENGIYLVGSQSLIVGNIIKYTIDGIYGSWEATNMRILSNDIFESLNYDIVIDSSASFNYFIANNDASRGIEFNGRYSYIVNNRGYVDLVGNGLDGSNIVNPNF
jgi:hypothetical protein